MTSSETQNLQRKSFRKLHSTGFSYGNKKDIQNAYLRYLLRPGPNLNLQWPDPGAGAEQTTINAPPIYCEVPAVQVKVMHSYVTCVA